MAHFPSRFLLSNNFLVSTQPVSDEIIKFCQIHMLEQPATQQHNIILEFKLPAARKMAAV